MVVSESYAEKIWSVGDGLSEEEQRKASKGTIFIPYSQFPPKRVRSDCLYHHSPSMMAPISLQNLDSCEVCWSVLVAMQWLFFGCYA